MSPICEVWGCTASAVETLVFCNPLTAGTGTLAVCERHRATHVKEHLL